MKRRAYPNIETLLNVLCVAKSGSRVRYQKAYKLPFGYYKYHYFEEERKVFFARIKLARRCDRTEGITLKRQEIASVLERIEPGTSRRECIRLAGNILGSQASTEQITEAYNQLNDE